MPIKDGFQATQGIREFEASNPLQSHSRPAITINGRIPIFAVSASLEPVQREYMESLGMDGWMLKPIDFKRMNVILKGITNPERRRQEAWEPGFSWESGGWLLASPAPVSLRSGGEEPIFRLLLKSQKPVNRHHNCRHRIRILQQNYIRIITAVQTTS
jgi:CheY-like chemotaxis protein